MFYMGYFVEPPDLLWFSFENILPYAVHVVFNRLVWFTSWIGQTDYII